MRGPTQHISDLPEKTDIAVTAQLSTAESSEIWMDLPSVWHVLNQSGKVCLKDSKTGVGALALPEFVPTLKP